MINYYLAICVASLRWVVVSNNNECNRLPVYPSTYIFVFQSSVSLSAPDIKRYPFLTFTPSVPIYYRAHLALSYNVVNRL